jgi:hypothetical protein
MRGRIAELGLRAVDLAQQLSLFNSKPFDERARRIAEHLETVKHGNADGARFGIATAMLEFVEVNLQAMGVFPRSR